MRVITPAELIAQHSALVGWLADTEPARTRGEFLDQLDDAALRIRVETTPAATGATQAIDRVQQLVTEAFGRPAGDPAAGRQLTEAAELLDRITALTGT